MIYMNINKESIISLNNNTTPPESTFTVSVHIVLATNKLYYRGDDPLVSMLDYYNKPHKFLYLYLNILGIDLLEPLKIDTKLINSVHIPNGVVSDERLRFLNNSIKEGLLIGLTVKYSGESNYDVYLCDRQEKQLLAFLNDTFLLLKEKKRATANRKKKWAEDFPKLLNKLNQTT